MSTLSSNPQGTGNKRPAPRGNAAYPRKRAVTACEVCRARRTKCDNQRPACGFCTRTGAKCNYSTDIQDYSAYDAASLRILERLDDLEVLLRRPIRFSADDESMPLAPEPDSTSQQSAARSWLLPCSPDTLLTTFADQETSNLGLVHSPVDSRPTLSATDANVRSPISVADLDTSSSRQHVENFFDFVHIKNPILHEETTRAMVSQLSLYGADWSTESCLALLICALGSIATRFDESSNVTLDSSAYVTSQSYFRAAERRLGNCLTRSGILEAQCLFFAGVYQMCIFRPFDAWRLFSQSLSCCQNFVFLTTQSAPTYPSPGFMSQSESSQVAEQSVYWSAWKSESELRSYLNLPDFPSAQSDVLYPPFFPTPPSPTYVHGENDRHDTSLQRESMSWYFYLTEISLRRLMSRMVNDMLNTDAHSEMSLMDKLADCLTDRLMELEGWTNALPEPISLCTSSEFDNICKFVIRGHLINAYEMLYWPFLAYYVLGATNQRFATQVATPVLNDRYREQAETALVWHRKRLEVNKPGFRHRHHGTWFMIISCVRSTIMLLAAYKFNLTASTSLKLAMPNGWQDAVMDGIQLNRFWQFEAADVRQRAPLLARFAQELGIPTGTEWG